MRAAFPHNMANQQVVQEAMRLIAHKNNEEIIETLAVAPGWKRAGEGAFKVSFIKEDVVVKAPKWAMRLNDSEGPLNWLKAYSATPRNLKGYMARVLAVGQHFIIQEKAPNVKGRTCHADQCEAAKARLEAAWNRQWRLVDGGHNHGHDEVGNPVWYDGI